MLFRQKGVKLDGFVDKNKQMKITGYSNYMNYMSKNKITLQIGIYKCVRTFLVVHMVEKMPAMWEIWV